MAPLEGAGGDLRKYLEKDLPDVITKYDKLWEIVDPEETPYESKYEARKLLEGAVKVLEGLLPAAQGADREEGSAVLARNLLFLGKNFYYCEEVPSAEQAFNRSLEMYLRLPSRLEPENFVHVQDAFNQLGMLWCNRHSHAEGMNFLRRAQVMFVKRPDSVREKVDQRAADNHTLTIFYLAQAYGALRKPGLSARFCAETMSQQLESNAPGKRSQDVQEKDPFDCKDWVRNCCSLSDFFVNECMFWTAEYLLHSALYMCEKAEEICGIAPESIAELTAEVTRDIGNMYSTRLKFAKCCAEHPGVAEEIWRGERKPDPGAGGSGEGTRLSFRCAADGGKEPAESPGPPIAWDDIFPEVVFLEDEEAQDNRLAEETLAAAPVRAGGGDAGTGPVDGKDVCFVELQPGELVRIPVHFRRLQEPVVRRMRRANAGFFSVRGPLAAMSSGGGADEEPGMAPSCAGASFEVARELFKMANHYQTKALSYFLLDGWVTEHVRILQELSQMYRTLQFWEGDRKRAAAMMARRHRMLCPLLELLNPKVYVNFWRQLSFETAEIFQELYELKAYGKFGSSRDPDLVDDDEDECSKEEIVRAARCNQLARKSLEAYSTFIDSWLKDGEIPGRIEEENCRVYLTARLNRSRLRTKMRGLSLDDQVDANKLALQEYEWIMDYGRRNPETLTSPQINMQQEIRLCEEMAGMLPAKLNRIASKRRR